MSIVAPLWLVAGGLVATGVVLAHLFSTSVPPREVLPTVRFVPRGAQTSVLQTRRVTDVLLLALRILAVAFLAMALAGAHVPRGGPSRVVLVDGSRAVGTAHAEFAAITQAADMVVFDTSGRVVRREVLDTLRPSNMRGSLSAGLVAAHRAIAGVTTGRAEIELVIVSPVVREEVDSATPTLIALWEGPIRIVRVPASSPPQPAAFEIRASGDDPVAAALRMIERPVGPVRIRIVRDEATSLDSSWARGGRTLVSWPSADSASSAASALAVSTPRHTLVGVRKPDREAGPGHAVAHWSDGSPAATESPLGAGCIRDIAIPVDPVGDIALRDSFRGLAREFLEPCGGASDFTAVPDSAILPSARGSRSGYVPPPDTRLPLILAMLALLALGAEHALRARTKTTT